MARKGMVTESILSWKILWVAEMNKYWLIDCIFWRNQVGADWDAVQPLLFKEYNRELEELWWWRFWSKLCCCWLWGWLGSCQRGHQVTLFSTGAVNLFLLKKSHIVILSFRGQWSDVTELEDQVGKYTWPEPNSSHFRWIWTSWENCTSCKMWKQALLKPPLYLGLQQKMLSSFCVNTMWSGVMDVMSVKWVSDQYGKET